MSNVQTILADRILGKLVKLDDNAISKLGVRFEMLWEAFETMTLPGSEVVHNGEVVTNNDEVVFNTPAAQEIITVVP